MSVTMSNMERTSSIARYSGGVATRPRSMLRSYQQKAIDFCLHHAQVALWLDMGLGKTAAALTVALERINLVQVYGALVVAPLRVIQTVWRQEAQQWEHTRSLRFSLIHGVPNDRHLAYFRHSDIYLVNYEGLRWLCEQWVHRYLMQGKYLPVNMVIFDEISKLKDSSTKRHEALRQILPFIPYRLGLTGTPAANGYLDLFGQYLALDSGARLGTSKSAFTNAFFSRRTIQSRYEIDAGAQQRIEECIGDITLQMSAEDYLELPAIMFNDIWVELPPEAQERYEMLENQMFMELDSGTSVEVFNAAALSNKCLQAANGAVYVETGGPWEPLHEAKLEALDDVVEEAAGKPLLLSYLFRHDAARITERVPKSEHFSSKLGTKKANDMVARWNTQQIPMMIGHPASMGHGLNLQEGSDTLVWFGIPWSLEQYQQTIDRLAGGLRRTKPITVHRILAQNTADIAVRDALEKKETTQSGLKAALNEYRRQKGK